MIHFAPDTRLGGRYRLLERLGAGGFAQVWRALKYPTDTSKEPQVIALKIIDRADDEALLLKEPRVADALGSHAHIVRVLGHEFLRQAFGDGVTITLFLIAMEYVPGRNLRQIIGGLENPYHPIAPAQAIPIILQVLDALEHAQERGVVHRDIKPENIIVTPAGQVKVADFGISRLSDEVFTSTVRGWGTPPYMPPELSRGQQHASCDLYATGMMLYEMLAGAFPFPDTVHPYDLAAILPIKQQNAWIPLGSRMSALPGTLEAVILRAIDAVCERRYRWAREMSADLQRVLLELEAKGPVQVETAPIQPATPPGAPPGGTAPITAQGLLVSAQAQVERNPTSFEAHFLLAKLLYRQGAIAEAQAAMQEAMRLEPNNPVAWEAAGDLLRAEGQVKQAIAHYRKAFLLRQRQPSGELFFVQETLSLQEKLGELYIRVKDFRSAQRLYQELLVAEPNNALSAFRLGLIAAARGDAGLAVRHLEIARSMRPDVGLVHNKLAQAYRLAGDLSRATAAFNRAIELAADDSAAWLGLAEIYQLQGATSQAKDCARRVLALDSEGRDGERARRLLAALG